MYNLRDNKIPNSSPSNSSQFSAGGRDARRCISGIQFEPTAQVPIPRSLQISLQVSLQGSIRYMRDLSALSILNGEGECLAPSCTNRPLEVAAGPIDEARLGWHTMSFYRRGIKSVLNVFFASCDSFSIF